MPHDKIWHYEDPDLLSSQARPRGSPSHGPSQARGKSIRYVDDPTDAIANLMDEDQVPSRPESRTTERGTGKPKSKQVSRHNSRQNASGRPFNMPYQTEQRRNASTDSIDSDALLDHRYVSQSMPRPSFIAPRASVAGASTNGNGNRRQSRASRPSAGQLTGAPRARKSTLSRAHHARDNDDDDSSPDSSNDERTGLLAAGRRPRKSSSALAFADAAGGSRRKDRRNGDDSSSSSLSPSSPRSVRNPNYPPSMPSSFGSRRASRVPEEPFAGGISASMTGKDAAGDTLRVNMAKRVMQHVHRGSNAGKDGYGTMDEDRADMSSLPAVMATSPPGDADTSTSPGRTALMTDDDDELGRGRLQSMAEADVCFPTLSDYKDHGHVDFEALQEWAREQIDQKEGGEESVVGWRHRKLSEPMLVNGKYRNRGGYVQQDRSGEGDDGDDQRPFRFTFFTDQLQSTVHSPTLYELPQEDQTFRELFSSGETWWLDVNSPSDAEMKILSDTFGIHPLTTEDITMEEQREKVELFRHYYLVSFRSFQQDPEAEDYLEPVNMYIIVFRNGILTFHFGQTPHPANVRRRIRQLKDFISVSADWISYALIDDIVDAFSPLIHRIEYEVDTIDENVLGIDVEDDASSTNGEKRSADDEQANMLRRIGSCRKKVMGLLRLLGSKADVIKGFAKRCNEQWDVAPRSEIGLYLGDIQDHIVTMVQNLNHYEKILSRSHSNYLAQISIGMTKVNNDTNDVLSRLTVLGTMLIPMNLVTGLWGMNVPVPGQESEGLHWFFSILGCMAVFFVLIYFLGRRSGVV